ncbi:hypothetical protein RvY_06080 [Ramazzottius varieornatus]|uniref:Uncharacterized protein n=1 Tax=Ramazzottius varieornatus TaxID=947166 RepID=A0A1D1UXB9_RAMVA|nr:hypothetical protein RvY_06080 [Ramazzottius varieornatus]
MEGDSSTTEMDSVDDGLADSQWDLFREALITEVRKHPTLFGRKHRDTARRKEAWVTIAETLERFMDDSSNDKAIMNYPDSQILSSAISFPQK